MFGLHRGRYRNCVHSHKGLREKTTEFLISPGKLAREWLDCKTRGSGERWLRPVIRSVASEHRRSIAIRALPLPNSIQ